jgi:hypothetical protein
MEIKVTHSLTDYFEALERIRVGRPTNIPKGTKITNNSVSLEAGRKIGSIKKSRTVFTALIQTIDAAAMDQSKESIQQKNKLDKAKTMVDQFRSELEASLAREVSLLYELYEVKKQLARLTGVNVIPIR